MPRRPCDEIDLLIGKRIRSRRLALGMTQAELGTLLSVSFQQVQKYERGFNRLAAADLPRLAAILRCKVTYFLSS